MKKIKYYFSQISSALFFFGCILSLVAAEGYIFAEIGGKDPGSKVLIVSNKKKLNDPVISKITKMLRKEGNYVTVSTGTDLKGKQPEKYGAIIIINFVDNKTKDRSVEVFADENVQKKIVLLNAVGDYLAPEKGQASSKTVKAEKIASDIVERTRTVLLNQ